MMPSSSCRSRGARWPSLRQDIERPLEGSACATPSSYPTSIDTNIGSSFSPERPPSTKRRLSLGGGEDSALGEGSKRPRLHSPTLPAFRNAKGHSYEAPTSPPAPHQAYNAQTRFGEDIDDHDGDTGAVGLHLDRNTTISFTSGVASTPTPTNSTGVPQAIQHFFENASNITIGRDFLVNIASSANDQLLFQLLQANLAQRGLSQPVGYTRENGVRIVDALGDELVLPPSIMRQYSDVHELMLKHFWGKLGEERVVENRYCIVTERNGALVQPENWERTLNSGEGLIMCMTVRQVLVEAVKDTCPQCGKTRLGTRREDGWLIWYILLSCP
ncbi:hypothetical protein FA13DRAFT_473696 [Coprinellus micaceus]|uniref:Ubiquitin-like domain-containing protein n=1 Tax=Coprinellus micaceus TaxID=71717 RepID=A0A4Y7T9Y0_COPMI|nr:hypothetical protein FA13DRAFT_473696 [Coprinellus micaceus]